jgi:hypothetical protein
VAVKPGGPVSLVGGKIVNVSPYGMLIHSPLPMETDAVHRFRLFIEKDKRDVDARVAACHSKGAHRYEVGLEFVGAGDELRSRLSDVLAALESDG